MPQEVYRQANFTSGELDPACLSRRDLKAYVSSLALMVNHLTTPQGPIRRRPGLAHVDYVRNILQVVATGGATVTAPNGGDVAGLGGDGFVTTTPLAAVDGYVIAEWDFGAPVEVGIVDLYDFAFVDGGGGGDPGEAEPPPPQYPWRKFELNDEVLP